MTEPLCEWCGHHHTRAALCTQRPKWSRRGFLALFGAGLAGAMLPSVPAFDPPSLAGWAQTELCFATLDAAQSQEMLQNLFASLITPKGLEKVLHDVQDGKLSTSPDGVVLVRSDWAAP